MPVASRFIFLFAGVLIAGALCACQGARKTLVVDSDPPGAAVWINGVQQESLTPVRVPFEWYGSFEVRLEQKGYESLATEVHVPTELDGYPVVDLVLLPFAKDKVFRRTLTMKPVGVEPPAAVIDRVRAQAESFRARTLSEIREPGTPAPSPEAPGGR